jgi:hypothetical protein
VVAVTIVAIVAVLLIAGMVLGFIAIAVSGEHGSRITDESTAKAAVSLAEIETRLDTALMQHEIRLNGEALRREIEDELKRGKR